MSRLLSKIPEKYKGNILYNKLRKTNKNRNIKKKVKYLDSFIDDTRYDSFIDDIENLRDIHNGDSCFIICTGPSINNTNLNLIKDEILFGVNTINKLDSSLKFEYYATSDYDNIWKKHRDTILKVKSNLFLGGQVGKDYLTNKDVYVTNSNVIPFKQLKSIREIDDLEIDVIRGLYTCRHVPAAICLQLTYHMGFKEVYLVGCDCNYSGEHHFYGTVDKHEMDHMKRPKYWDEVFEEYEILRDYYENNGRKIYNATVGGMLEVFERKKLEDVV